MSVRAMKWAYGLFEIVDLPPAERSVLLALCWDHTDAGGCYPTQERISVLAGYRERRVRDLLQALEGCGLIERRKTRTKGKFEKTSYTLFGTYRRQTGAGGRAVNHRHCGADGDHRQTGAVYRGSNTRGEGAEVIRMPDPVKRKIGGGA